MGTVSDGGNDSVQWRTGAAEAQAPSTGRWLLRGAGYGALLGMAAGFFVPWLGIAAANGEIDIFLIVLLYGTFTAAMGGGYGVAVGAAIAALSLPCRNRPRLLRRLGLLWGATAAALVVAIGVAISDFSWDPGPNQTDLHVREELYGFFVFPAAAAALCGFALPSLLDRRRLERRR